MSKPLIVMALQSESEGVPESQGFQVLYCGVGKINATFHLTRRLTEAKERGESFPYVLNLGSAGSAKYPRDSVVASTHFVQRDMDATGIGFALGETPFDPLPAAFTFPDHFPHLPHGICGSGDSFVQDEGPLHCALVDMEAYALAKVCHCFGMHFACVKYVTDGADHAAARDWQENLHLAAKAFEKLLKAIT